MSEPGFCGHLLSRPAAALPARPVYKLSVALSLVLSAFVFAAVLLLPGCDFVFGDAPPERQPPTAVSYNIHHEVGEDGALDPGRISEVIRAAGADVVALQEVDRHWSERSDFADQASELAGTTRPRSKN